MPIEFRCTGCQKLLRVSDESAGKKAKCPECSMVLDVPSSATSPPPGPPSSGSSNLGSLSSGTPAFSAGPPPASDNPYQAPLTDSALPSEGRGQAAPGEIVPTIIETGEVISRSWELFKSQMGIVIGAYLIVAIGTNVATQLVNTALERIDPSLVIIGSLGMWVVSMYLNAGNTLLLLDVARGRQTDLSRLFQGGPIFVSFLLATIVVSLIVGLGFVLLIIPGVILALMFNFAPLIAVDRNAGVGDALSLSKEITTGNKWTLLLLCLVAFGIMILGFLALCVGILFTAPFVGLIYVVAYLMASGQPTGAASI